MYKFLSNELLQKRENPDSFIVVTIFKSIAGISTWQGAALCDRQSPRFLTAVYGWLTEANRQLQNDDRHCEAQEKNYRRWVSGRTAERERVTQKTIEQKAVGQASSLFLHCQAESLSHEKRQQIKTCSAANPLAQNPSSVNAETGNGSELKRRLAKIFCQRLNSVHEQPKSSGEIQPIFCSQSSAKLALGPTRGAGNTASWRVAGDRTVAGRRPAARYPAFAAGFYVIHRH